MQFDAECAGCLYRREYTFALQQPDKAPMGDFLAEVGRIIAEAPANVAAPYCIPGFSAAIRKYYGIEDIYAGIKKQSNELVMQILPQIRRIVEDSDDPLKTALLYSRTGNFLDFAVLDAEKIHAELDSAIENTPKQELDSDEYGRFRADLQKAKQMLILGDNAGEIGFDVVLVEQLRRLYPKLRISYVVRGGNAQNDATRSDAHAVGMDKLVPILDNGSCIPSTELSYLGAELKAAIEQTDVILAKGQANFESMLGCGYNVYYSFLCKCPRLGRILRKPLLQPMFLNDKRLGLT